MSIPTIRKTIEQKLAALSPAVSTAYENKPFTPVTGTPFQRVNLMPNTPDNTTQGGASYIERGIFQIMLCYPINTGPAAAEAQAQLTRAHFKRGTSMVEAGIAVVVTDTPRVASGMIDDNRFCIPISVPWQAQIST